MEIDHVSYWVNERWSVLKNRESGKDFPWSSDPMFNGFRYCNVRRQDDKVSKYIQAWMKDKPKDTLVGAAAFGRLTNRTDALDIIGYPLDFSPDNLEKLLQECFTVYKTAPFNRAYFINPTRGMTIYRGIAERVNAIYNLRNNVDRTSLKKSCDVLTGVKGVGNFIAGQIIADLKYTVVLDKAEDWWTWATPGPGSLRGLQRVFTDVKIKESNFLPKLHEMINAVSPSLNSTIPRLCAQDWQNIMCETDKFLLFKENKKVIPERYRSGYTFF